MNTTPILPEKMINYMKSPHKKWCLWTLVGVAVIIVLWLGVSWLRGWFPFGYHRPISPQVPQAVLDSLTATGTPVAIPKSVVKSLTATGTPSTIPQSVLDSLTAK